ncbi:unnamed protein product, partial [Didymodactylos carnosus]
AHADFAIKLPKDLDPVNAAPLFCAGVTAYNALKVSKVRPGQWVSIVGIGGLGSIAVSYAKAMGMNIIAVVQENDKAASNLAMSIGANLVYDGPADKHGQWIQEHVGGVHAAIVVAVAIVAYEQALISLRSGGKLIAVALPVGKLSIPIFETVLRSIQVIGSVVGTRQDMREALELARQHNIKCTVQSRPLEDINQILDDMLNYRISGRIVINFRT